MIHHIHFNTAALLNMSDKKLRDMFQDAKTGDHVPPDELREILRADLRKGHTYFCTCDNRNPDGSCAGHPT